MADIDGLIDELLEEDSNQVKKSVVVQSPAPRATQVTSSPNWSRTSPNSKALSKSATDELNDLLTEVNTIEKMAETPTMTPRTEVTSLKTATPPGSGKLSARAGKKRCKTVYVGGSDLESGCTESSSDARICSHLFCTGCDLKVELFRGYEWKNEADYLFFRNNFHDFQKLKPMMAPKQVVLLHANVHGNPYLLLKHFLLEAHGYVEVTITNIVQRLPLLNVS